MRIDERARVEAPAVRHADSLGLFHIKLTPAGRRGMQDRLFFIPGGRPTLIEFKAPGEELRPLQRYYFDKLKGLNYDIFEVDRPEDGIRILDEQLKLARAQEEMGSKKVPTKRH